MGDSDWLHRAGVVMAFGLALDPGLVSLSRQAGSLMPALVFTLFALASVYNRRMVLAGICTGLALLSGVAFLQGLLILGISWGLYVLISRIMVESQPGEDSSGSTTEEIPAASIRAGGRGVSAHRAYSSARCFFATLRVWEPSQIHYGLSEFLGDLKRYPGLSAYLPACWFTS